MSDGLENFSPATREWFRGAFAAPTNAQAGAWKAIAAGSHTLVVAPTGSGKTLAAFLWAIDRLAAQPAPPTTAHAPRVLYISPLKALARRRRAQPALAAGRHHPDRETARPAGAGDHRRRALRRHPGSRPADAAAPPAGHPDHHAGVAVPHAHLRRPRHAARRGDGDRRRDPRGRRRPSAARTWRVSLERLDALLDDARRSGSGFRRPCGRWRRWPASSADPHR